jgi:hypothetical protein
MPRGVGESYAARWREPDQSIALGKVIVDVDGLRLEGSTAEGRLSRRVIPYAQLTGVRIGREPAEQLGSSRSLVLERSSGPALCLDVLGPGMLFELADALTALATAAAEQAERVVLVLPLRADSLEQARTILAGGPAFDPAETGLERHDVFLTDSEAVFLFEGANAADIVQRLVSDPAVFAAAVRWKTLLAAAPRLGRRTYTWTQTRRH